MGKTSIWSVGIAVTLFCAYAATAANIISQNYPWYLTTLLVGSIIAFVVFLVTGIIHIVNKYKESQNRNKGKKQQFKSIKTQTNQKQSVIIKPPSDELRDSLISARERAEALLEIEADVDTANIRPTIAEFYRRYGVAVKYLRQEHQSNPEYMILIIILQAGRACLNTLLRDKRNFSICKSKLDDNSREIISKIKDILSTETERYKTLNKLEVIEIKPITKNDTYYLEIKNNGNTGKFNAQIEIIKSETDNSHLHNRYTGYWELSSSDKPEIMHGQIDRIKIAHCNFRSYNRIQAIVSFTEYLDVYYFDTQSGKVNSWQSSVYSDIKVNGHHVIKPEYILRVTISLDTSLGSDSFAKDYRLELSGLTELDTMVLQSA